MDGYGLTRWGRNWEPWSNLRRMQHQIQRLLEDGSWSFEREFPPVNVYTDTEGAALTAEMPGVAADDLDISVQGDTVTIKGQRQAQQLKEGENYHRRERTVGSFVRTVQLPFEVEAKDVKAKLDKGVLELTLPRTQSAKPKKITVSCK